MVLGHEGVGVVEAVGPQAKYLKKGDRVGWGYEADSCGHCEPCLSGRETYCPERQMYGEANLDQGSMALAAVWREAFLFPIPDGISDEHAAPLQCGGVTVFNALHAYDTQPTETVGVMGVGGLGMCLRGGGILEWRLTRLPVGHMAIQFASKMGCRVVVISGSDRKDEAMKLGAHEFIAMKGKDKLETSRPLNRLIVTTSAQPDWNLLMPIMAPNSTIHPMSITGGDFSIPYSKSTTHDCFYEVRLADNLQCRSSSKALPCKARLLLRATSTDVHSNSPPFTRSNRSSRSFP